MGNEPLFADKPDDTRTAILKATFDALAEHGYADLTIDRISQHFPKSEGLIFHHYDGKDDILLDLLDYLLNRFQELEMPVPEEGNPETRLRGLFDQIFSPIEEDRNQDYEKVLMELRVRAAQDEAFRECFNQSQDSFRRTVKEILQDGIESGEFREVDPDSVADFLITLTTGEIFDYVTTDIPRPIRSEFDNYVEYRLLADETEKR